MALLVLAHPQDETALRVYCALRARYAPGRVRLISSDELVLAPKWVHRVDADAAATELSLANGERLDSGAATLVFNRIRYVSMPHFARARPADRDYAVMEMHALLRSWLSSLPCPVVNRATPSGLYGAERTVPEWLALAGRAGLPVRGFRFTTSPRRWPVSGYLPYAAGEGGSGAPLHPALVGRSPVLYLEPTSGELRRVLVAGRHVAGDVPDHLKEACRRLRELSGSDLIECRFERSAARFGGPDQAWRFCGGDVFPEVLEEPGFTVLVEYLHRLEKGAARE